MVAENEPAMTTEFVSVAQTCVVPVIFDDCTGSATGTTGAGGAGGGVMTGAGGAGGGVMTGAAEIVKFREEIVEVSP